MVKRFSSTPNKFSHHKTSVANLNDLYQPPSTLMGAAQVATLGAGYDSTTGLSKYQCLKPAPITYAGGSSEIIALDSSVSYDEFYGMINEFQQSTSGFWIFSHTTTTEYTSYARSDAYSQSFFFYASVTLPTTTYNWQNIGYGTELLNDYGLGMYENGNFREGCGDNIYSSQNLGATLFVTLKAQFNSVSDASIFYSKSTGFQILPSLSGGITTLSNIATSNSLDGSFVISAYQLGGNPAAMIEAVNYQGIVTCAFNNIASCETAINQIIAYATENFPTQVYVNSQGEIVGNPASNGYGLTTWESVGISVSPSPINGTLALEVSALIADYLSLQVYDQKINAVMTSPYIGPYLNTISSYGSLFTQALNNVTTNIAVLNDPVYGIYGCALDADNCQVRVNYINTILTNFDQNAVDAALLDFSTGYLLTFTPQQALPAPVQPQGVTEFYMYSLGDGLYLPVNQFIPTNPYLTVFYPPQFIQVNNQESVNSLNITLPFDAFMQYHQATSGMSEFVNTFISTEVTLTDFVETTQGYQTSFDFMVNYALATPPSWTTSTYGPYAMGLVLQETNVTLF